MTTNVTRLKELLFDAESQRLDDLQHRLAALAAQETEHHSDLSTRQTLIAERVDQVFARAGTEERLKKSVAGVLDGAFREAEVTRHEQLSQAVAPLVVKTIKNELRNSQDEMVDVLYPITGKLVKEYVRAAIADLMADINRKLGGSSPSELETRAKALGISVGELVVAEAQELKVDELFLVRKGSGQLVAHWERPDADQPAKTVGQRTNRDELIAGYLTGITQFSEEAFDGKPGSLRSIDLKGEKIFVRSSPAYLLAARCSGRAPVAVEQVVDDAFLQVLTDYRQALGEAKPGDKAANSAVDAAVLSLLPNLAADCERRFAKAREDLETRAKSIKPASNWRPKAIAAAVLLPLLGGIGWWAWLSFETSRTRMAAEAVLGSVPELEGYPVQIEVERGGKALTLGGLMPTPAVRERTLAALDVALKDRAVVKSRLGLIPTVAGAPDLTGDVAALRRQGDDLAQRLAEIAVLKRDLASLQSQHSKLTTDLAAAQAAAAPVPALQSATAQLPSLQSSAAKTQADLAALAARVEAIRIPVGGYVPTPREQLDAFTRVNAIFFANGADLLDEPAAVAVLDQLVTLLAKTDAQLRILGYTDERGNLQANTALAQSRADRVAALLADRGVSRDRLIAVGRGQGLDINRAVGVGSANRRVSFEVAFVGEPR
jgi:outer membrane protein OmpA-like peptidoglycan-associated protein